MKYFVLAEKPSVGKEIAKTCGCYQSRQGYKEGPEAIVSWALGHLGKLCDPDHYDPNLKRWSTKTLPILPKDLEIEELEETKEQLETIRTIFKTNEISYVVIATDAGREGELVARWILQLCDYKGPIKRLWVSSQTEAALEQAFKEMKDGKEYDGLYQSAFARSCADWYVGLNVTRALTCKYDMQLSAGRVQTPTLALICQRETDIENHKSSYYYQVKAKVGSDNFSYAQKLQGRANAEKIEKALEKTKKLIVSKVERTQMVDSVPLAYDLTALQVDANTYLNFSAKKTLDVLQRLYEFHKIVTYPRTDSRHITQDIVPTLGQRLVAIMSTPLQEKAKELVQKGIREDLSHFVNSDKVSDHHALLPTEQVVDLSKLNEDEEKLWSLIAVRFLEVLSSDYIYESISVTCNNKEDVFSMQTTNTVDPGYREIGLVYKLRRKTKSCVVSYKEKDELTVDEIIVEEKATAGPEFYTEATLLNAMENAGRLVEDKELKKFMGNGLGTPATRADIIEKLLKNNYIIRDNKYLRPTSKGRELVRICPDELTSADLTGKWETKLEDIGKGKTNFDTFMSEIKNYSSKLVKDVLLSSKVYTPSYNETKECPYCKSPMMGLVNPTDKCMHYICQKLSCRYEERIVPKKTKVIPKKVDLNVKIDYDALFQEALNGKKEVKKVVKKDAKKVVVKKSEKPQVEVEVVRESNYNRRHNNNKNNNYVNRSNNRFSSSESSTSGGTFADFIKASQERNKKK